MMLLLIACQHEGGGKGRADGGPFVPADTTGFTAVSQVTGEIAYAPPGIPWCSVSVAITGTRQDDVCSKCDYAFTLAAVATFSHESADDCTLPVLATMMADSAHIDPFLAYNIDYYEDPYYHEGPEWYVHYSQIETTMDVEGDVESHPRVIKRFFDEYGTGIQATAEGFSWDNGYLGWLHSTPLLWTACSDSVANENADVFAATVVEESFREDGTADRWLLPLVAGDEVSVCVGSAAESASEDYYDGYLGSYIYIVRPDGCLGQAADGTRSDPYSKSTCTSFGASEGGDWHVVIVPEGSSLRTHNYRLTMHTNGLDTPPARSALIDDDAQLYEEHIGSATIEGTWLP